MIKNIHFFVYLRDNIEIITKTHINYVQKSYMRRAQN